MDERQNKRINKLFKLGLQWNGDSFTYKDINFHHTDTLCMTDEQFEKAFKGAEKRMVVLREQEADQL